MNEIKPVLMKNDTILGIVNELRRSASYTRHPMSNAIATEAFPCTDQEVKEFLDILAKGGDKASLTISDIFWEESGNCVGDELYPVKMEAVKLPDGRYYITVSYLNDERIETEDEYIYGDKCADSEAEDLKLYAWYNFEPDYTGGLALVLAESLPKAREILIKDFERDNGYFPRSIGCSEEVDIDCPKVDDPEEIDLSKSGVVVYLTGGA